MHTPAVPLPQKGFTLVELMVAIALLAILLSIGVPSFTKVRLELQRDNAIRAFQQSLQLARSEAIKRSQSIEVCVRLNSSTCATDKDWSNGWLVKSTDTIINDQNAIKGLSSMGGAKRSLVFLPNGLMSSGSDTVTVDPTGTDVASYQITINILGRTTVAAQ